MGNRTNFGGDFNDGFCENVEKLFSAASTGERALIVGVLQSIDYAELAQQMLAAHGTTIFSLLDHADANVRALTASCLAQIDDAGELSKAA